MSNTSSKNILLSQSKIGQSEGSYIPALAHTSTHGETTTEVKVEIPGINPATVLVGLDNNTIHIHCAKGELTISVNPAVDTSKIKADIMWGMLTLIVPGPDPPASRSIKVSVHDAAPAKKSTAE